MKYLLLMLALTINTVNAHPQYTMTPSAIVDHLHKAGWWAWVNETQKLAFCVGTDINNKPVCTVVPNRYVVIEYTNKVD